MAYTLQGKNDCAIVSICNYTGKAYEDVIEAGRIFRADFEEKVSRRGTSHDEVTFILAWLTKRAWTMEKPRRGQDKLSGILSWHHPGRRSGHMTACIQGNVFDTNGQVVPIREYAARYNYNLRLVWR